MQCTSIDGTPTLPTDNLIYNQVFLEKGGRFTLSDDSHGVDQVATDYNRLLRFVEKVGIKEIVYFQKGSTTRDPRFPGTSMSAITLQELQETWARISINNE